MNLDDLNTLTAREIFFYYSKYIFAALAGILLGISLFLGYNYYQEYAIASEHKRTQLYLDAYPKPDVKASTSIANLEEVLGLLDNSKQSVYPNLVQLQLAKLYNSEGNSAKAIESLQIVIDAPFNDYFLALASYRLAILYLNNNNNQESKKIMSSLSWPTAFDEKANNLNGILSYQEKEYNNAINFWQRAFDASNDELQKTYYKIKISDAKYKLSNN